MYYSAYNLCIYSEAPLPELPLTNERRPDVWVRYDKIQEEITPSAGRLAVWQSWPDSLFYEIENIARFKVTQGREIVIDRAAGSRDEDVRVFLLGSVLAGLLQQRGILTLHASAIQTSRGAVLFVGKSGSGKSTLLAAFAQRGYKMLADDVSGVIVDEQGKPVALPAFPRTRLWADAVAMLGQTTEGLSPVRASLQKYLLPVDDFCDQALPLYRLYVLNTHNRAEICLDSVAPTIGITLLAQYTYRSKFLRGAGANKSHLQAVTSVLENSKVAQIKRPATPYLLAELVEGIEADLG